MGGDVLHSLVHMCLCVRLMKGFGLIWGLQTSVMLTVMNHTAPGSMCARGCEARLSKLMHLFT